MKIALCDDSRDFQLHIHNLCMQFFSGLDIAVEIDEYLSGKELLAASSSYDLILLDMNMPDMTGIEVGHALRKVSQSVEIIFITSFAEYAIDGYQVQAFSYLLKDDLNQTFRTCMSNVVEKIKLKNGRRFFKFVEGHMSITLDSLIYVESQATKLVFHVHDKENNQESTYHLYGKMDDIQTDVSGYGFIRTNQSYLVNAAFIKRLKCYYTELVNNEILSIPKARYGHVKEQYALYKGGYSG